MTEPMNEPLAGEQLEAANAAITAFYEQLLKDAHARLREARMAYDMSQFDLSKAAAALTAWRERGALYNPRPRRGGDYLRNAIRAAVYRQGGIDSLLGQDCGPPPDPAQLREVLATAAAVDRLLAEKPPPARPHYSADPLVDQNTHLLGLHVHLPESARRGRDRAWGCCSCGLWCCSVRDEPAVLQAFDEHMQAVQDAAHASADHTRT